MTHNLPGLYKAAKKDKIKMATVASAAGENKQANPEAA